MPLNSTRLGELLGVDPTDSNAIKIGLADLNRTAGPTGVTSKVRILEDFLGVGATLADNPLILITQTGSALTAAAINAGAGPVPVGHRGWLAGKTDDVDAEIDTVALGKKPWMAVNGLATGQKLACEIGFVIPTALTARQYYFGFSDVETIATAHNGILNITGTTTVVDDVTDAAGFVFSSLATGATKYHAANTNAGTQAYVADSGLTGVVDKYTRLRVEVDVTGKADYYGAVDTTRDVTLPLVATKALAVATTALLQPAFNAAPTTTTGVEWEIDYILAEIG